MPSRWLVVVSWCALAIGFAAAIWIAFDIYARDHRQRMAVMEAVWPLTALYAGPLGVWAYYHLGAAGRARLVAGETLPRRMRWSPVAVSVTHCGAGCVLGDIVAEFIVFGLGLVVAGQALYAEYLVDYVLAIAIGVVFQYFVISRMRAVTLRAGLTAAARSDVVALTAFEIGLFGWMALMRFVYFAGPHLSPNSPVYWLFMQIGMLLGFVTSWPANSWLIRVGIKDAM